MSQEMLRRYLMEGALVIKVGRRNFFDRRAIVAWRESHRIPGSVGWELRKAIVKTTDRAADIDDVVFDDGRAASIPAGVFLRLERP